MYFILKDRFQLSCANELFTYRSFQLFKFVSFMWGSLFCALSFLCSLFSAPCVGFLLRLYFDLPEFHIHTQLCSYSGSSVTSRVEMEKLGWKWPFCSCGHSASVQIRSQLVGQLELNERSCFFRSYLCSITCTPAMSLSDTYFGGWRWHRGLTAGDFLAPSSRQPPSPSPFQGRATGARG